MVDTDLLKKFISNKKKKRRIDEQFLAHTRKDVILEVGSLSVEERNRVTVRTGSS